METKEKTLKSSGSCPAIAKRKLSRTCMGSFRSTTVLVPSARRMKRLSRGAKRATENQSFRTQQYAKINIAQRAGDGLHQYSPIAPVPKKRTVLLKSNKNSSPESTTSANSSEVQTRHIDVLVRIRPLNKSEENSKKIVWRTTDTTLVFDPKEKNTDFYFKGKRQSLRNGFGTKRPNKDLSFGFDYVYGPESTNEQIFEISLKGLIDQVVAGFNCTVFAYGATGSGKTYTMLGSNDTSGVTVLMAEELYRKLEDLDEEYTNEVKVSYLEVYNEAIKDLLNPDTELHIREDGKQGIRIPNLTVHRPQGAQQLLQLLKTGNNSRSQHATDFNAESSRSHAVFEITVLIHQHSPLKRFKMKTAASKLFMVDLAGSERGIFNGLDGMRQREGANINKSLLALSNCINALADGKTHIPYRNSKLTRLLKDSLSGNCVTVMIANISPSDLTFDDTHNTLHYANRAKNIKVTCKKNCFSEELIEESAANDKISSLENQIRMLKNQLEDERHKHQQTKDMLQEFKCRIEQGGEGDGIHSSIDDDFSATHNNNTTGEMQQEEEKAPASVIHDPAAVEKFLQLMKNKNNFLSDLTESSINARRHEWKMNWKKLKVDMADYVGRLEVSDPHFINLAKLKNSQSDLSIEFPNLMSATDEARKNVAKVNSEIENVYHNRLETLKLNDPFLTVSLQEFINYRQMEIETSTLKQLEEFYRELCESQVEELTGTQVDLLHCMKFLQSLRTILKEQSLLTPELEDHFRKIIALTYGYNYIELPSSQQRKFSIEEDIANLKNTVHRPILNLPSNEPPLLVDSSLFNISHKESSDIPPTTATSSNQFYETSGKDTYRSSNEKISSHNRQNNKSKYFPTVEEDDDGDVDGESFLLSESEFADTKNIIRENQGEEGECLDSYPAFPISSSSTDSLTSEDQEKCLQQLNLIDKNISQYKQNVIDDSLRTLYKCGSTTIGIRPTNVGLALGLRIRPTNSETNQMVKNKPLGLQQGKAMINLASEDIKSNKVGKSVSSHNNFSSKRVEPKLISNPYRNISSTRIIHPIEEKGRRRSLGGGRPFTFMYKDDTSSSTSSFET